MIRLSIDPAAPQADVVARAANAVRKGGVVAIPTDTLYGLAANPFDAPAVARVFEIKGRTGDQALPLIAADRAQVVAHLGPLTPRVARLADRYWPGPLTVLMRAPVTLAPGVSAGTGRVGVRVPAHPVARALCAACAMPLTATSANRSGQPSHNDPDDVVREVGEGIEMLLDAGRSPGGPPSTIVDVTAEQPVLVRAGAIRWEEVLECLALE